MSEGSGSHESRRTVLVALAANVSIALAKGAGGVISGSSALLSEAAHSVADTTNQVFLLSALHFAERDPDEEHPFGYGKERFFWSFLAAVGIFVAGAGFSAYEGLHTILAGGEDESGFLVPYLVLGFSLLAEGSSLVRAARQTRGEAQRRGQPTLRFVGLSRDPTTKTVVFEDSAAVTGVLLALAGVGLQQATGNPVWQGIASLAIAALLVGVAIGLGRDTKGLLIGEAALPGERRRLREVLERRPEVDRVVELLTMAIGADRLLVAVRVDLASGLSSDQVERASDEIDAELRRAVPAVTQVFLDATPRRRARAGAR